MLWMARSHLLFLSTLSLRRATKNPVIGIDKIPFLSTLSLRRATLAPEENPTQKRISIHALLAESDSGHDLRGRITQRFLSTLSLRRATVKFSISGSVISDFYPRSPCGERRESQPPCGHPTTNFYPRSPCGERPTDMAKRLIELRFLSTLSLRRATVGVIFVILII